MSKSKDEYKTIIKSTSLFGGVQIINIIIAIIRSKFIAVFLGPSGMGVVGLLQSTIGLIGSITNFGLRTSAVKDIAVAVNSNENERISVIIIVLRKLVWFTGLLGMIITIVFSSWLSKLTFGNTNYTIAFIWLSITLLFNQLSSGQSVLLQGFRKLKLLAKSSVLGSIFGLIVTVPIYYFYGEKGIVPVLILTSLNTLILSWYFSRKIKTNIVNINFTDTYREGKQMMTLGFMLSLSGLITMASSFLVRIYINNQGSIDDVGLYNAGFAIIGTYVGLIFSAMGTDFYPKLSGIAKDNEKSRTLINQQAEISILIIAPILTIFIIFINWVVTILYSTKFIPINGMIHWAALGMYFKTSSWAIGFILLANGASKIFFWSELVANIYLLLFNIIGYKYMGLDGLGISFLIGYIIYLFQVYYIANYNYNFSFNKEFYRIFIIQTALGITCLIIIKLLIMPWVYIFGIPLIAFSSWYSFKELDKRIGLKTILINRRNNNDRK